MVKNDKLCCPKCKSTDLVVIPDEDDPLAQHAVCDECGEEWAIHA